MATLPSTSTTPAVTASATPAASTPTTPASGTSASVATTTPAAVTVTLEDPSTYYCGLCRPKAIAMKFDPARGYLCSRHGDGMTTATTSAVDVTSSVGATKTT